MHAANATGIITITQIHPISATFTLPQDDLPAFRQTWRRGPLAVLAYSSDDSTELDQGTLLTPDNTIDATTGTIRLKATFPNPENKLWPGQFINAHLQTGTAHDAVTVPPSAIQHGPDGLYVYVVESGLHGTRDPVTIGYQNHATRHGHQGSQRWRRRRGRRSVASADRQHDGIASSADDEHLANPSSVVRSPHHC